MSEVLLHKPRYNKMQVRQRIVRDGKKKPPQDVPRGHLAVLVGEERRRFVLRADFLKHPVLRLLLDQAYEEYGHANAGPIAIPCDEFLFEDIINYLQECTSTDQFSCPFMAF